MSGFERPGWLKLWELACQGFPGSETAGSVRIWELTLSGLGVGV